MPDAVGQELTSHASLLLSRTFLCFYFVYAGYFTIRNFAMMCGAMPVTNPAGQKILTIAVILPNLGGSMLAISNIRGLAWLAASALFVFCVLCIPFGHPWWKFDDSKRTMERWWAFATLALAGAMGLAAITAWKQRRLDSLGRLPCESE